MELALVLVVLVCAELACTVYLLARTRDYLRRLREIEEDMEKVKDADVVAGSAGAEVAAEVAAAVPVAAQASPEELAQAKALLDALGLGNLAAGDDA